MKFKQFLLSGIAIVALAGAAHAAQLTDPTEVGNTSTDDQASAINGNFTAVFKESNDQDTRIGALETTTGTILGGAAPTADAVQNAKDKYDGSAAALTGAVDGAAETAYDKFNSAIEAMPDTTPGEIADKKAWSDYLEDVKTASQAGADTSTIKTPETSAGSPVPAGLTEFETAVSDYQKDRADYRAADADRKLVTGAQADGKTGKSVADFIQGADGAADTLDRAIVGSFNAVDDALATKADADNVYTKEQSDAALALKADADSVYTKAESDEALAMKADADSVYTKAESDEALALKADKTYVDTEIKAVNTTIGDIDDLTSTEYFTGVPGEDGEAVAPESITAALTEADKRLKDAFAAVGGNATDIAANKTAIAKNTTAIGENTARIVALEEDVESLKGGVAMAVAMANAPVIQGGENGFSLSGGFGYYDGASAASVKAAFMPTDNIAITASVASDFGDEFAVGGGVGFAF